MKNPIKNLDDWIGQKIKIKDFTKADLEAYQLIELKKVLRQVILKSPYYQRKLADFPIESLKSIKDIDKLPLTDESDLKKEPMDFLAINQKLIKRIVTLNSSGTTGLSKRIFFTENDISLTIDFFKNGMALFTKKKDRVLILLPGKTPDSIGDLLKKALYQLDARGIIYGVVDDPQKVSRMILEEKITGIVGIPQQVFSVCREDESDLIKRKGILRSVLLSTDYCSPALVSRIEKQWGVSVYEHYGSTEMGYGCGVFCDLKSGYHLREADFIFEIIDPITEKVLPPGESGEVVFTTLTREAMPLIRYRTGDNSRFLKTDCLCLTRLKTMQRIAYRSENKLCIGRNYLLTLSFLEDIIFQNEAIEDFKANIKNDEASRKNAAEVLVVELIFKENQDSRLQIIYEVKKALNNAFKKEMEENQFLIQVSEGSPGEIDLRGMKKRKIIDRRNSHE